MQVVDRRADKLYRGRKAVAVAAVMRLPMGLGQDLYLTVDPFPVLRSAALEELERRAAPHPEARVHLSRGVLLPSEFGLVLEDVPVDFQAARDGSWVGLIDPQPNTNWGHPCVYVLVDADGRVRTFDATMFPRDFEARFVRER